MCKEKQRFLAIMLSVTIIQFIVGWTCPAQSQEKYPIGAIEIIVPMAPGGSTDLTARIEGPFLSKRLGVQVNVVNKPGGATVPACLEVYRAAPNGYTLLQDGNPSSSYLPNIVKNLPFKIMDRTFVALTAIVPMVVIVSSNSPFKNLKDIESEALKDPENFTWTSIGGGAVNDVAIRQFLKAIGVDVLKTKPIISQGGAQSVIHTAGGHVKMGVASVSSILPGIKGGMLRALAVSSKNRCPDLPDVPTTEELNYPAVTAQQWVGISGPPNMPFFIVDKLEKTLQEVLRDQEVISKLKNIGATPFYRSAREMREYVMRETEEIGILWGTK